MARRRRFVVLGIQLTITAVVLALIASRTDLSAALARLAQLRPAPFCAALACLVLTWPLTSARWFLLLQQCDAPLGFRNAARTQLASLLMSQAVPTVGGDAWRVMAVRRAGFGWAAGLSSVILDRYFALLGLTLLVGVTHPLLVSRFPPGALKTLTSLGLVGALVACGLVLISDRLLANKTRPGPIVVVRRIAHLARDMLRRRAGLSVVGLSITAHLASALSTHFLADALDVTLSLSDAVLLTPPVILLAALPISLSGWGVREGSAVAFYALAGIEAEKALSVSVALGLSVLVISLPGAVVVAMDRPGRR